jgi:hypothetical protein
VEAENVFYMVWEPGSGRTRCQHGGEAEAVAEAKRLARQEPEKVFYVLKAISKFRAIQQPVAETMLSETECPF